MSQNQNSIEKNLYHDENLDDLEFKISRFDKKINLLQNQLDDDYKVKVQVDETTHIDEKTQIIINPDEKEKLGDLQTREYDLYEGMPRLVKKPNKLKSKMCWMDKRFIVAIVSLLIITILILIIIITIIN